MSPTSAIPPRSRRTPWIVPGVIVALLLVFFLQTLHKSARPDGNDLTSYLSSARALLDGVNPYTIQTPYPYVYPLFLALLLVPLAVLPPALAVGVWFLVGVASLLVSCRLLVAAAGEELGATAPKDLMLPGGFALLLLLSPVQNDLLNGQVNLVVLAACVLFLSSYLRGRWTASALWLAAAIALKLLPGILLLFLLMRKRFRLVLSTVSLAALLCLLPGILAGEKLSGYYRGYLDSFLLATLAGEGASHTQARIAGLHGAISHFAPEIGRWVWVKAAAAAASVAAIIVLDRLTLRARPPRRDLWPFCAYLVGALMLTPIAETHHFVLAIPAVVLLGMKGWVHRERVTAPVWLLGSGFAACFVLARRIPAAAPLDFVGLVLLLILLAIAGRPAR